MKIKVESEKIVNAVKKLDGIEIVLENPDDAKEAINLIIRKTDLFDREKTKMESAVKSLLGEKLAKTLSDEQMMKLLTGNFDNR